MSDDEQVDLEALGIVESNCEFCGRVYYLDPQNMRAMHDIPMCPEFAAMDPLAFAAANRKIKESRRDSGGNN